jgi:transposase
MGGVDEVNRLPDSEERFRRLEQENRELRRENERLRDENSKLRELVERLRRSGKRQAAPFSKGPPKPDPKPPGRKPGAAYGPKAWRRVPEHIDAVVDVPLPAHCDHCGGVPELEVVQPQYQAELPPIRPYVTQFNVAVGRCRGCGRRLQGRHPLQTSDALGAAASQLGPRALALATDLHTGLGLPFGKVSALFATAFGFRVTPGGLCLALHRVARRAEPTYRALALAVRQASVVAADETGWKVGGWLEWLWVFVSVRVTVYAILPGRGFEQAALILGEHFDGILNRDGWAPYRKFIDAEHQTCLTHLMRRCHQILETAERGAARLPHAIQRLLEGALALRDRRDAGLISPHGLAVARGRLEARMDRLLTWQPTVEANHKFLKHLGHERPALFTFLRHPEVEATNWWGEHAIRPAVVTRKVCGGNRTWLGAHTQTILMSVLRTCHQQDIHPYTVLERLLRSPVPRVARQLLPHKTGPPPPRHPWTQIATAKRSTSNRSRCRRARRGPRQSHERSQIGMRQSPRAPATR